MWFNCSFELMHNSTFCQFLLFEIVDRVWHNLYAGLLIWQSARQVDDAANYIIGICTWMSMCCSSWIPQHNVPLKTEESSIALIRAIDPVTMIYDLNSRHKANFEFFAGFDFVHMSPCWRNIRVSTIKAKFFLIAVERTTVDVIDIQKNGDNRRNKNI